MKTKLPKVKQELKELSSEIRKLKALRGPENNGRTPGLASTQWDYRHTHIAYCMFHGTPYEKIESPEENNKADMAWINKLIERYKDEAIHTSMSEAI
jgi:hypothetical protein